MNRYFRFGMIGGLLIAWLVGFRAAPNSYAFAPIARDQLAQTFVGEYRLQEFTLELTADGKIILTQAPHEIGGAANAWRGAWHVAGDTAIVRIIETRDGKLLLPTPEIRFNLIEGFPTIVGRVIPGIPTNPDALTFTLGTGQRHPLARNLNRLLAQSEYLNYKYPERNDDLYNETIRNAVANFQSSQHLSPTGAVDAHTWQALLKPIIPSRANTASHRETGQAVD